MKLMKLLFLLLVLLGIVQGRAQDVILSPIESQPDFTAQSTVNWGIEFLGANDIDWNTATRPVTVYVFDTAGDLDHPDLAWCKWPGYTATGEQPKDLHGHGLHVAGIVGGRTVGIASKLKGLRIVPVKVLSNAGSGTYEQITNGAQWALEQSRADAKAGRGVVWNFSLGGGGSYAPLEAVFKQAVEVGVFICASSGNTGGEGVGYPASSLWARAVASLDKNGLRSPFSTFGAVELAGPGGAIYSTWKDGKFATLSGTSMSSPAVAACAAALQATNPGVTNEQLTAHFRKWSVDLPPAGYDKWTGYGTPDLRRTYRKIDGGTQPPPPPPPVEPPGPCAAKREKRFITVSVPEFVVMWQRVGQVPRYFDTLSVVLSYETDLLDDCAADFVLQRVREYNANRGYGARPQDGSGDIAGYWVHFFEMIQRNDRKEVFRVQSVGNRDHRGVSWRWQRGDRTVNKSARGDSRPHFFFHPN